MSAQPSPPSDEPKPSVLIGVLNRIESRLETMEAAADAARPVIRNTRTSIDEATQIMAQGAISRASRSGSATTEYQAAQSSSWWGTVGLVLGLVVTIGSAVATWLGADTEIGIVAGAAVAIAAQIQTTLTRLGYIKSRTTIKAAALSAPRRSAGPTEPGSASPGST